MTTGISSWVRIELDNFRVRMGLRPKTEPLLDLILKEDDECTYKPPVKEEELCTVKCFNEDPFDKDDMETLRLPYEDRITKDVNGNPTPLNPDFSDVWNCLPKNLELESYLYKVRQANYLQGKQIDAMDKLTEQIKRHEKRYIKAQNIFRQRREELDDLNKKQG